MLKRIYFLLFFMMTSIVIFAQKPLKVLAIGNSFSEDATEQYLSIMALMGGRELVVGNLYYPGCSIEQHLTHMEQKKPVYSYRKMYSNGYADTIQHCTITRALIDEKWDVITFQQGSAVSGIYSSYKQLPQLIKRVRTIVGPHPEFLWHQTWAYAPESTHTGFKNYSNNQLKMYEAIVECTKKVLADNPELKGLIPTGTAIQDARTSFLGTDLTRDGYHLDKKTGRYIAACTWYGVLFSRPFTISSFLPAGMSYEAGAVCRWAAHEAIKHPYEIVESQFEAPEIKEEPAGIHKQ